MTPRYALMGLGAVLAVLVALAGVDSCRRHQGQQGEVQAAIHQGEANAHASQAQAIPDHTQELQAAQADVDRAQREVARLRAQLAAQCRPGVPGDARPDPPPAQPVAPDHRDELLVAQGDLIDRLQTQVGGLKVALDDEKRRSEQWRQAFEAERKATAAQAAATEAWKKAVTTSRWRGRGEGAVVGALLGLLGGKR